MLKTSSNEIKIIWRFLFGGFSKIYSMSDSSQNSFSFLKCAVKNCGKMLAPGEEVTIGDKKYCKQCAGQILVQAFTYGLDPPPD